MNIIKLNNTEFEVESYNKTTYFNGENVTSNANMLINTDDITVLNNLAENPINTIQILHDNDVIYNLTNANAQIENINEYLNFDKMNINVNLRFDNVE